MPSDEKSDDLGQDWRLPGVVTLKEQPDEAHAIKPVLLLVTGWRELVGLSWPCGCGGC